MRYADLKQERDEALARAIEAERLSMKSEFDRVTREFEEEKARLLALAESSAQAAYKRGFADGRAALCTRVISTLNHELYGEPARAVVGAMVSREENEGEARSIG